ASSASTSSPLSSPRSISAEATRSIAAQWRRSNFSAAVRLRMSPFGATLSPAFGATLSNELGFYLNARVLHDLDEALIALLMLIQCTDPALADFDLGHHPAGPHCHGRGRRIFRSDDAGDDVSFGIMNSEDFHSRLLM